MRGAFNAWCAEDVVERRGAVHSSGQGHAAREPVVRIEKIAHAPSCIGSLFLSVQV